MYNSDRSEGRNEMDRDDSRDEQVIAEQFASDISVIGVPVRRIKPADEARGNLQVFVADPDLALPIPVGGLYEIRGRLWYKHENLSSAINLGFNTADATFDYFRWFAMWTGSTIVASNQRTLGDQLITGVRQTTGYLNWARIHGFCSVSTPGQLDFYWGLDTIVAATLTLQKGSYIEAAPII